MVQFMLPNFLSDKFKIESLKLVNIDCLYVGLLGRNTNRIRYVSIKKTPHYYFVKNFIDDENMSYDSERLSYGDYSEINSDACSVDDFIKLIENIMSNGYIYKESPICVFKHWSRPLPVWRLDVADGFHRLAVLAALGETKIMVCKLKYKNNIISRLVLRLTNLFFMD